MRTLDDILTNKASIEKNVVKVPKTCLECGKEMIYRSMLKGQISVGVGICVNCDIAYIEIADF
jgi:transcription elongation factor Elf1